jgi:tRNA threonylcarbamoyladenosine biosynthesis protein TsaE
MTVLLHDEQETMKLGRMLSHALCSSSVHNLYLFADLGGGKTTLTRGFVSGLPGGDKAEISSPSFTLYNIYPTQPEIIHADLYRLSEGTSFPEEMEELLESDSSFLILEWPEKLAQAKYAEERMEIRLFRPDDESHLHGKILDKQKKSCKCYRLATLDAYGCAAHTLLHDLMPQLKRHFVSAEA